jgi:lipoprotein-anchoring transpeptidase ErfK/SrfK
MDGFDRRKTRTGRRRGLAVPVFSHNAPGSALWRIGVPVAALALLATACTSSGGGTTSSSNSSSTKPGTSATSQPATSSSASSSPVAAAVKVSATPKVRKNLSPATPITVTAANGTLSSVELVNPAGKKVTGAYSADKASWHTTEVLGYSKTYRLTATAANSSGGTTATIKHKYTTLTPNNVTMPYFNNIYGSSLVKNTTYGVGMIPVVHFDETVTNEKAAQDALTVTTTPHVDGAWYWSDNQNVHWRPKKFYTPGTKVTITAKLYGVQVGDGLYGQADKSTTFKIGSSHIAVANAKTHQVKVYWNGKLKRTMPTSMGQGGVVSGKNGQSIYLWTMPGTYTVINFENPATMSSDSYGLPANSPYGYAAEKVPWATKISTDGIYLHELDTTVWAQGHQNVSHGCLNLNQDNAQWYFQHSKIGDVVKVVHSGGPKIKLFQGGDWSVPWAQWKKGDATTS